MVNQPSLEGYFCNMSCLKVFFLLVNIQYNFNTILKSPISNTGIASLNSFNASSSEVER